MSLPTTQDAYDMLRRTTLAIATVRLEAYPGTADLLKILERGASLFREYIATKDDARRHILHQEIDALAKAGTLEQERIRTRRNPPPSPN